MALVNGQIKVTAISEDGRQVTVQEDAPADTARDPEKMLQTLEAQLAKRSGHYAFGQPSVSVQGPVPFLPVAAINGIRRDLALQLDALPVRARPLYRGAKALDSSYKMEYACNGELMRTKYCIRHQLGLCPKQGKVKKAEPLFLRNGKERLQLTFDCAVCEMTVS